MKNEETTVTRKKRRPRDEEISVRRKNRSRKVTQKTDFQRKNEEISVRRKTKEQKK